MSWAAKFTGGVCYKCKRALEKGQRVEYVLDAEKVRRVAHVHAEPGPTKRQRAWNSGAYEPARVEARRRARKGAKS